ncbi:DUF4429 domain-containing protein [Pseudomonas shirazensis]|uniref:DUF4429 domain-containing protein n=1 Tax=Pseudomonas shirazensis TaxID=2745494 RepID=A0ABU9A4C5_9PSED
MDAASDVILKANGHNGQLELTNSALRIKRKGALAFLTQGFKGDKEIPIKQITSIQFKKASIIVNGYIQFTFNGSQEAKGGVLQGASDENTVMFRSGQQKEFNAIRDELQKRMNEQAEPSKPSSSLDDLEKLATLKDKGVITDEEFQLKKKEILGL